MWSLKRLTTTAMQMLDEMAETVGKEFNFVREAVLMDAIYAMALPHPLGPLSWELTELSKAGFGGV